MQTLPNPETPVSCRQSFLDLLHELPAETIVRRTMSGTTRADEMATLLEAGHPEGLAWVSDVLRVSRDYLVRQAAR